MIVETTIAIYARYSSDKQNETSIEDQVRRCLEAANRLGLGYYKHLIFKDSAVSGTEKGFANRHGYHQMMEAWGQKKFSILIVDEFSRLSRDGMEQARLIKFIQANKQRRLLTSNGLDSNNPNWHLSIGIIALIAQEESRNTSHRVSRGMEGQLERGYMIAPPAYGYDLKRIFDEHQIRIATEWTIAPDEARIVKQIFTMRSNGHSMHQIAAWLNTEGIPCSRKARLERGGFWRPSRVKILLRNTIYRGVFTYHGSTTYAKKQMLAGDEVVTKEFLRPQLRIVDDETWFQCNANRGSRSNFGGGNNVYSGIITCGCCGGFLHANMPDRRPSVSCSSCSIARSSKKDLTRQTSTVSIVGIKLLYEAALMYFVTDDFIEGFRNSLRLRLEGPINSEVHELEDRLKRLIRIQERFLNMLASNPDDDLLETKYKDSAKEAKSIEEKIAKLRKSQHSWISTEVIQTQLQVDPREYLMRLFDMDIPVHTLKAKLKRLFPSIVFEGKTSVHQSYFRVRFCPGMAIADASNTALIFGHEVEARFGLKYQTRKSVDGENFGWNINSAELLGEISQGQETSENDSTPVL